MTRPSWLVAIGLAPLVAAFPLYYRMGPGLIGHSRPGSVNLLVSRPVRREGARRAAALTPFPARRKVTGLTGRPLEPMRRLMPGYNPEAIEPKWQRYWEEKRTFRTPDDSGRPKFYILDMFPYPSGAGLHVGHPEGYTATDILARYGRMRGDNVMHPMGWDAFGLPAEQYAIETGTHPRVTTQKNIETFRRQIKRLGFSYDWDREVDTTDPSYFKWTQWIFLQIYDTWYDPEQKRGRPISELPIPAGAQRQGDLAVRQYQDEMRLAYQVEA